MIETDLPAANGLIHVIGRCWCPRMNRSRGASHRPYRRRSLFHFAGRRAAAGQLNTFGEGPAPILAPTDDAFAQLPEGTVESLLLPENRDQLAGLLLYHVIAGSPARKRWWSGRFFLQFPVQGEIRWQGTASKPTSPVSSKQTSR